jgi:hypothetical protein
MNNKIFDYMIYSLVAAVLASSITTMFLGSAVLVKYAIDTVFK